MPKIIRSFPFYVNEWPLNLELNYNWFENHFVLLDEFLAIFKLFWKCMYCSSNSCGWVLTRVLTGLQMKDFKWSIKPLNKWDKTSCHFLSRATGQDWNKSIIYSNWLPWISRERERVLDIICDTWKGQIFLRDWVLQRSIKEHRGPSCKLHEKSPSPSPFPRQTMLQYIFVQFANPRNCVIHCNLRDQSDTN